MSKALIHSNSYLRDAKKREKTLERNVKSSSAVEGIWVDREAHTGRFVQKKSASNTPKTIGSATKSS
jgi:hypothetical protein